jgi:hypothetical protein
VTVEKTHGGWGGTRIAGHPKRILWSARLRGRSQRDRRMAAARAVGTDAGWRISPSSDVAFEPLFFRCPVRSKWSDQYRDPGFAAARGIVGINTKVLASRREA